MNGPARPQIQIVVDDRECRAGVLSTLRTDDRFAVQVQRLAVGDYRVDSRFLFERKTLSDLVHSIISGRLFHQALRLVEQDELWPALILEGTSRDLATTQMSWEAIQGALVHVNLILGLPVLRTRNASDTVNTLAYAARQHRAVVRGGLPRKGRRPRGKRALQHHVLQSLPGIGPTRAARLIDHFGNIRSAISASAGEWAQLEGIGENTAERIDWTVREVVPPYAPRLRCEGSPGPAAVVDRDRVHRKRTRQYVENARASETPQTQGGLVAPQ
ncbi:MAG: hypothetical protein LC637_09540 [Xanthomonadaceae bacterium]|nr:hypothetical protein [Xanthomonadaceae bacterium]